MRTAVTIKDIAEQLGLSRNTVAKALNGKYVPEETRDLILNKARELNYKSFGATGVNVEPPRKSKRILLLSGKPLNNISFFVPIIKSIENYCYTDKHELFQYTFNTEIMTFTSFAEHVKTLNADGIIAIETFDKDFIIKLINLKLPICFIDFAPTNSIPMSGNFDIVKTNDIKSVYGITRQLHKKYGIKNFCFVGDITHCMSFQDRYFGMIQALTIDNIPHTKRDDILRSDKFNYGNTAAIKSELYKLRNRPECFICANDFIARSVCDALEQLKIKVPDNCLVVGYDNVTEASSHSPSITSFGCDKENLGIEAASALLNRINQQHYTYTRSVTIHTKAVYRTSTDRESAI
ncbi:MAG: LacI family DNA-binding transcriptional regulator [Clostridiales bacterium]|nr:LacI family DNA-binding transcriptional regulator [Clostridiales bacterium]